MTLPFLRMPDPFADRDPNRRTYGRRLQEGLECELGKILDLSRGGMRVLCREEHEGEHEVTLKTFDEDEVVVKGTVRWSKKVGKNRYEIGLEFSDVDMALARKLAHISTMHGLTYEKAG